MISHGSDGDRFNKCLSRKILFRSLKVIMWAKCGDTENVQYCYSPKHTVGEQLLDVRRDKRERAAYAATENRDGDSDGDGDEEDFDEQGQEGDDMDSGRIDKTADDSDGQFE